MAHCPNVPDTWQLTTIKLAKKLKSVKPLTDREQARNINPALATLFLFPKEKEAAALRLTAWSSFGHVCRS